MPTKPLPQTSAARSQRAQALRASRRMA